MIVRVCNSVQVKGSKQPEEGFLIEESTHVVRETIFKYHRLICRELKKVSRRITESEGGSVLLLSALRLVHDVSRLSNCSRDS